MCCLLWRALLICFVMDHTCEVTCTLFVFIV